MKIVIRIRYAEAKEALAISQAVGPDNIDTPPGMRIRSQAGGNLFTTTIESSRGPESVLSTVEDLCSCVQAAERALSNCEAGSMQVYRKG